MSHKPKKMDKIHNFLLDESHNIHTDPIDSANVSNGIDIEMSKFEDVWLSQFTLTENKYRLFVYQQI